MYFLSTKIVDDLQSLVASEEALAVDNLQDPLGSARWRSTGLTPYIYGQFAEEVTIDAWGVWYTNARSGDQARLRLADTQANLTAAPVVDTGLVDVWPSGSDLSGWFKTGQPGYVHQRAAIASADQAAASWFRVDFDYTGNADGYVEAGVLLLAVKFGPSQAHEWGWKYRPNTRGGYSVAYASGGSGRGGGTFKRDASFKFPAMTESDLFGGLDPHLRERRSVRPMAVVLAPDEVNYPMNYMFYGYLDVSEIPNPSTGFTVECSITEP